MENIYRNLTKEEIDVLRSQLCVAEDWQLIKVKEGFSTNYIYNVAFFGNVTIGVLDESFEMEGGLKLHSCIRNVKLCNCNIGDHVYIENVQNYIANYTIKDHVFIQNLNLLVTSELSSFGNGVAVSVLNETGGREVLIYNELSAHFAYVMAFYRHSTELIAQMNALVENYAKRVSSTQGLVERYAKIVNCDTIKNVKIGEYAVINSASRLENGSINSNAEDPIYVEHNVVAEDFIFSSGAHITDGAMIMRSFVGQACHIGHQFSAHDSLFFCNCQCENGEACAVFAGPYTVTMHKSSLLIAGLFSFLNAGSGSNQSNHMYKLGPIHQGVVERGSKTTSDSYILWPARIGAFSLIMGRHVGHPDTSELPFSYLIENNNKTYLVPAVNVRSVGTVRDAQKWPKRDKRKDSKKMDLINFYLLSPYTIDKMERGRNLLNTFKGNDEEHTYNGTYIKHRTVLRGRMLYTLAIEKYIGNTLIRRLQDYPFDSIESLRARLHSDMHDAEGTWCDVCGLLIPKKMLEHMLDRIKSGELDSVERVNEAFRTLSDQFAEMEWAWTCALMLREYHLSIDTISVDDLREVVERWIKSVISMDNMLFDDAQKEFSEIAQTGFGVDGDYDRKRLDFDSVRGTFSRNTFVNAIYGHIDNKSALADDLLNRLQLINNNVE